MNKTVEELLERQTKLLEEQNTILLRQINETHYQNVILDRANRARRWEKDNPVGKFFWRNPEK